MHQKLKSRTFENIIQADLTSAELNFIVYLSHFQNDFGTIIGVYYKDICEAINVSYQTFYDALRNLSSKGIISYEKRNYDDWDITILNNDFSYEEAVKEGYISMGHAIFDDPAFYALKAPEKILAIHIMRASGAGARRYCIGADNFYDKFCGLLKVSRRVIRGYLKRLKKFFSIGVKDSKIWVTLLKRTVTDTDTTRTDKESYSWHIARVIWRRNHIKENKTVFQDTFNLIKQYAGEYKDAIADHIGNALQRSIALRNQRVKYTYKWNREINPKYVHLLLKEELA